ncbi:MAG: CapA family protein [Myxococcales bacterium]|nr:CapA family protein [Myxococcales bacterium]
MARRVSVLAFASIALSFAAVVPSGRAIAPEPRAVTIAATGDVMLHLKVNAGAAQRGWAHVFGGLARSLREDEIAFANLETPLVDDIREPVTGSPPILGAPTTAASALATAGLDVLGCANNHAYDQTGVGMARTVEALRVAGVVAVGADVDPERAYAAEVVERGGLRVAFLSYTEQLNRGGGEREPRATVAWLRHRDPTEALRAARSQADLVVLAIHWSHDFVPRPLARHRALARAWVAAGADLVLGTGPHVLQEVERLPSPRGDAVVAYSLGNMVSNQGQRWQPRRRIPEWVHPAIRLAETRDGILLRTRWSVERGRVGVEDVSGTPLWTINDFWERAARRERHPSYDIRVVPLREAPDDVRAARMAAIAAALGPEVRLTP